MENVLGERGILAIDYALCNVLPEPSIRHVVEVTVRHPQGDNVFDRL
jgi:hypothetical protein